MPVINDLQKCLADQIPLTGAIGIKVVEAGEKVVLKAPLAPNLNHKRTAFGGSLYSVAVLAGWSWIWVRMQEEKIKGHIVIAGSEMEYQEAVTGDFTATCLGIDAEAWDRAVTGFERRGKARVTLEVAVESMGKLGAVLIGDYAIVR